MKWKSCKDRLPRSDGEYLVTMIGDDGRYFDIVFFHDGKWGMFENEEHVEAWMELPDLYEPPVYIITTRSNAHQTKDGKVMVWKSKEMAEKQIEITEELMRAHGQGNWCGEMFVQEIPDASKLIGEIVMMEGVL